MRYKNYYFVGFCIFCLSTVITLINYPGHISWDSSVQLYEAHILESVNIHPPFMSMYLSLLGGGERASSFFVFINYAVYFFSIFVYLTRRQKLNKSLSHVLTLLFVLLNPVVMHYSAIVWKDVLQATFLILATFLAITRLENKKNMGFVVPILLAIVMLIKLASLAVIVAYFIFLFFKKEISLKDRFANILMFISIFTISFFVISNLTKAIIHPNRDPAVKTAAYKLVLGYDIAGSIFYSGQNHSNYPLIYDQGAFNLLEKNYSNETASLLLNDKIFNKLNQMNVNEHLSIWLFYLRSNTFSLIKHKVAVFKNFFFPDNLFACSPLFVGVSGNKSYLDDIGIHEHNEKRNREIYQFYKNFLYTPLFYHLFYFVLACCCLIYSFIVKSNSESNALKYQINCLLFSQISLTLIFYFFISMGCDFRYLYSNVVLSLIVLLNTVFAASKT